MEFNHRINYSFDYLFGGSIAFLAQLSAKNASAYQQQQTFQTVKDQLTLLSQLRSARSQAARAVSNENKRNSDDKNKGKEENNYGSRSKRFVQ